MALADIRHEVVHALAHTKEAEREARAALAHGSLFDKVQAAGELVFLARQKTRIEGRLGEIDTRIAERRTLFAWIRQAWFSLMLHFESWIAHG